VRVAILSDMDVPREGIRVWVAAGGHDVVHSGPLTAFDSGVSGAGADVAILVTYPDGNSVSYGYDSQGNLATETDGNGDEMKYVWDQAGNLASVTYPDGNTVAYAYDGQGRMSSLTDWLGNTTGFKYDSGGNLTETDYPNSTVTTYGYDSAERLNKIATTKSGVAQFSFDASGSNGSLNPDGSIKKFSTVQIAGYNLTPGSSGGAGTDTYTYDPLSRMTADTQTGTGSASISSSFNNNGEIATTNGGGPQNGTYGHDTTGSDAGQLNSITSGSNVTSFGYNGQGDTTSCSATTGTPCSGAGSATYTFDEENRLIKETDSLKGPETILYDGNGLLQQEKETIPGPCPAIVKGAVKRHAPAPMTASPSLSCLYTDQLTWSTALGDPTLASTHTWSSSLDLGTTDYVMGPDGSPVEQLTTLGTSTTPEWYYADFQGNTRVLMDARGSPQVTYNYPAWGATTNWVGTGNGTPLQYNATFTDQWTGLAFDPAGGWYSPLTGQSLEPTRSISPARQPYTFDEDSPIGSLRVRAGSSLLAASVEQLGEGAPDANKNSKKGYRLGYVVLPRSYKSCAGPALGTSECGYYLHFKMRFLQGRVQGTHIAIFWPPSKCDVELHEIPFSFFGADFDPTVVYPGPHHACAAENQVRAHRGRVKGKLGSLAIWAFIITPRCMEGYFDLPPVCYSIESNDNYLEEWYMTEHGLCLNRFAYFNSDEGVVVHHNACHYADVKHHAG